MALSNRIGKLLSPRASRILIVFLALLVLTLSLLPRPETILGTLSPNDKLSHLIAYVALGFFAMRALDRRGMLPFALVVAGCAAFGGILEIVQPLVGRTRELADFVVDVAGSAGGAALALLLLRLVRNREEIGNRRGRDGS